MPTAEILATEEGRIFLNTFRSYKILFSASETAPDAEPVQEQTSVDEEVTEAKTSEVTEATEQLESSPGTVASSPPLQSY